MANGGSLRNKRKRNRSPEASYENKSEDKPPGTVVISPQLLRHAVKVLQMKRMYVSCNLIENYLRQSYPVQTNPKALRQELLDKLKYAVCVGLIAQNGEDKYSLPTLRQEASALKSAFTAFWDMYNNNKKLRKKNRMAVPSRIIKKKKTRIRFDKLASDSEESILY